ncbi:MAG: tetratricopeptide repeat protein [Phycisphaerales bacterium]
MRNIPLTILVLIALALTACGGPTKAGLEARKAARDRIGKTSSLIVYDQARQSFESGQFDRALVQINEAIIRTPEEPKYWVLRGRILLEQGHLEESLKDFQKAIAIKPECAEAYYFQGIVHERWSRDEDAIAAYRKASELDQSKVSYLLACAEMLIATKQFDEAEAMLEPRLEYFENNAPMHELLAKLAMLKNDPKTAVAHYNRALLIDPSLPMVMDNLVRAQFAAGQWQDCLVNVRRAQREGEGGRTPERMHIEGRCLAMIGRTADARNVFAELTRETPEDAQAWIDLAGVSWQLGEIPRVRTAAASVLRVAPERYEGYVFEGLIAEQEGDAAAAANWFRKAAELGGANADANLLLSSLQTGSTTQRTANAESAKTGG